MRLPSLALVLLSTWTMAMAADEVSPQSQTTPAAQLTQRPVMAQMIPGGINKITDPRVYWSLVSNPDLTILAVFSTSKCQTCHMQWPFLVQFALERPDVLILELDAETMSDLVWRHQVRQVPTNVVWRGGVVVNSVSKGLTTAAFEQLVGKPTAETANNR